jgi:tRNA(Ile)-lysidine synthase TilS/MesJ
MNIVESLVSKFEFTLEKHHLLEKVEKIVVAFSGGRNSTVMLDLFVAYTQNRDIQLEVYFVPFPVSVFSDSKYQEIMNFWKDKGVKINVNNDDQLFMLDKGLDAANIPCLACKNVRREKIKNLTPKIWGDGVVLATGHSLDDIVAYSVETLFINVSVSAATLP